MSSAGSSPASFHTAAETDGDGNSTAASSPIHGLPSPYRGARSLPRELQQHCHIFLEEQLCKYFTDTERSLFQAAEFSHRG